MPKHILEVDSVLCSFGNKQLLTDVYLKCQTGEVIGLLGRNGSGKSTLLKIIFGTKQADNKLIRIDGKVYATPYRHPQLLAYLPQDGFLPHGLSLRNITKLFLPTKAQQEKVLENERVKQHQHKNTAALSTGERRFFEMLLLLEHEARFLLLDEPFSSLEPLYTERIQDLIAQYRHQKGIILTDHDYRSVLGVSSRLILLADGACRNIAHPKELEQWGYVPAGSFT